MKTVKYEHNSSKIESLQYQYSEWKFKSMDESGYFLIFSGFKDNDILKKLSGNALKLYIYLGINSNNFSGTVWHSNKTIAKYFEKSERTIRSWMKELEEKNLIKRIRDGYDGIIYSILLPYDYKSKPKLKEKIIGVLSNNNGNLNIKLNGKSIPISSGEYIEIFDYIEQKWIYGKIIIERNKLRNKLLMEYDPSNLIYTFVGLNNDEDYIKNINEGEFIKAKFYDYTGEFALE